MTRGGLWRPCTPVDDPSLADIRRLVCLAAASVGEDSSGRLVGPEDELPIVDAPVTS